MIHRDQYFDQSATDRKRPETGPKTNRDEPKTSLIRSSGFYAGPGRQYLAYVQSLGRVGLGGFPVRTDRAGPLVELVAERPA
jgi:hypothetical protein